MRSLLAIALLLTASSSALGQARMVRMPGVGRLFEILLPTSYAESTARYPVVYLFHGGGQDPRAFLARAFFAPMVQRHEFIVVMPAVDLSYLGSGPEAQRRYYDLVVTQFVDYVDTHYRTIPSRESRAIAGLSMGGRIATMTGLTHADLFGWVGAFSAALRPDVETALANAPAQLPFFYVSCGTEDFLLPVNRQFNKRLMERQVTHEYREVPDLGHTWDVWDDQIRVFFDLLEARGVRAMK